jgi:hypothetical protein
LQNSERAPPKEKVVKVGAALTLSREWRQFKAVLPAKSVAAGTLALTVEGWAPHERAATVWLDDAVIHVANATAKSQ